MLERFPDTRYDIGRGVVCVLGRGAGLLVFVGPDQFLEFFLKAGPFPFPGVEDARQGSPPDVLRQDGLFFRSGQTAFRNYFLECADGFEVAAGFGFLATFA